MSGHSKWSSIKHKKAKEDSKRGKIFSKIIKEITIAARAGGGDPGGNPRLRQAIEAAKAANMPADNIKRAVQKGTGELPGMTLEEHTFEGYGPGGVAILVYTLTDNRNRTLPEIRHLFSRHGGNLGEPGCVSWLFSKRGYFVVDRSLITEEDLMEIALSAGADDLREDGSNFEILAPPEEFEKVQQALEAKKIRLEVSEVGMIPQSYVKLEGKKAEQMLKLLDELNDHDDVQNVWANFDIDESQIES
jgi:YebC/PmpR family DNA-binding regulatory protein